MRRSCGSPSWDGGSKRTSAAPRTSNGAWSMMNSRSSRAGRSPRCSPFPRPMFEAGGRLFVDVVRDLGSPTSRARLLVLGKSDPLIGDALQSILERDDFIPSLPDASPAGAPAGGAPAPIETDPTIVTDLIARNQESIAA